VTTREVPHGNPALAVTAVEEFYANLALKGTRDSFRKAFGVSGEGLLRRPGGPTEPQREQALAMAERKARKVSAELFEVRVCATCHAVSRSGEEWRVAPVRTQRRWMPHARFDHKTHAQAKCGDCHDVTKSKKASDVAMPTIDACRECHAGSRPAEGKVTSNCMLCHGFHDSAHPWDPGFMPRGSRIAVGPHDAH
jgi:predicted CXXCH cytochrome family protein